MRTYGNRKRERLTCSIELGSSDPGSQGWRSALSETARHDQERRKPKIPAHLSFPRMRIPAPFVVTLRMMEQQLCFELLPVQVSNT
jgi:hypothetical protein